jgi:hypothetical protein
MSQVILCCLPAAAGELPLPFVRLLSTMRVIQQTDSSFFANLEDAGPGFTLPANIGDLDTTVTVLDLSYCNLTGLYFVLNDD